MSKTLADLRAAPPSSRPERSVTICLRGDLVGKVQTLTGRINEAETRVEHLTARNEDGRPQTPTRAGQGESAEVKALRAQIERDRAELAGVLAEMAEHEGDMGLRANLTDGEWRRWVNEHPARDEGKPGAERDQRVTYGVCDADALLDDLATYAHAWNDEPLAEGDYGRIFEPNIATADKAQMAQAVVTMYESRLDFHLLRSSLSANLERLNAASSPARSGSATSGSTGGKRARSNGATTSTAAKSA